MRRAWLRLSAIALVGVIASSCAGSGYKYVKASSSNAYYKIPKNWELFDKQQVIASTGAQLSAEEENGLRYLAIFDADPKPSLDHDLQTADHPFGVVRVRRLNIEERDTFSLAALRNEVIPVDEILDKSLGDVEVVNGPETITQKDGLRGTRIVYTVAGTQNSFTVDQTGLVDPATNLVYFFIVGCTADCYSANRRTITEIADSWTVKEP
ncbi:MAG: hypothetical protein QOG43_2799 [Actinomycetota bacterium]|jgi:hypothetical protein|nr:hypothetical protein [Actinomycetota bacterium]